MSRHHAGCCSAADLRSSMKRALRGIHIFLSSTLPRGSRRVHVAAARPAPCRRVQSAGKLVSVAGLVRCLSIASASASRRATLAFGFLQQHGRKSSEVSAGPRGGEPGGPGAGRGVGGRDDEDVGGRSGLGTFKVRDSGSRDDEPGSGRVLFRAKKMEKKRGDRHLDDSEPVPVFRIARAFSPPAPC